MPLRKSLDCSSHCKNHSDDGNGGDVYDNDDHGNHNNHAYKDTIDNP